MLVGACSPISSTGNSKGTVSDSGQMLTMKQSSSGNKGYIYSPKTGRTMLRTAPGTNKGSIAAAPIKHGTPVTIVNTDGNWYQVSYAGSNKKNWIHRASVAKTVQELNAPPKPKSGGGLSTGDVLGAAIFGTLVVAPIVDGSKNADYSAIPIANAPKSAPNKAPSSMASPLQKSASVNGVKSIKASGRVSGTDLTAQTVFCNNGKEWRIWRSNGQWWDGRGAQGGNYRSLSEQAVFLCN